MSEASKEALRPWWPTNYIDEIMPRGRLCPNAWIIRRDGAPYLAAPSDWEECKPLQLNDGDVVKFSYRVDFGDVPVILNEDGHAFQGPLPIGYESCCILDEFQIETYAEDAEEMVQFLRECDARPGRYFASFYTFVDAGPYRFVAASGTFEPVVGQA